MQFFLISFSESLLCCLEGLFIHCLALPTNAALPSQGGDIKLQLNHPHSTKVQSCDHAT